jgi:hypothetical protein
MHLFLLSNQSLNRTLRVLWKRKAHRGPSGASVVSLSNPSHKAAASRNPGSDGDKAPGPTRSTIAIGPMRASVFYRFPADSDAALSRRAVEFSCVMKNKRRKPLRPEDNAKRLIEVLEVNLSHAKDPQLRRRLQAAIDTFKHRAAA